MKVFITGICWFVGSSLARGSRLPVTVFRFAGSIGRELQAKGIEVHHGDVRVASDLENLPGADWVIDAVANPTCWREWMRVRAAGN